MKVIITNAFSLNMLDSNIKHFDIKCNRVVLPATFVAYLVSQDTEIISAVGHADTAAIFSAELGREVRQNRCTVTLEKGTLLLVGQYRGPRLEEGTTTLPEGASIDWFQVSLE